MPASERPHILILGGTGEAAALARLLADRFGDAIALTTSLAGRTQAPAALPGRVRRGGFGGPAAMARALTAERVGAVIDATHPFAATISAHAEVACRAADVPRLVLWRPPWSAQPGDQWFRFATAAAAASALPRFGRRAFLTVGARELAPFAALADFWFLVRLIEMPRAPLPLAACQIVTGRGPFTAAGERRLMETHEIDVLVTKASGGRATAAKLAAARELALPVVMIERPPPPAGPSVASVGAAVDWLAERL